MVVHQPKLLQKWQTARVRNGTKKKVFQYHKKMAKFTQFKGLVWYIFTFREPELRIFPQGTEGLPASEFP